MRDKIIRYYDFFSKKVVIGLGIAIVLSLMVFLIETSFVFVLQGFLTTLGIMDISKTNLPEWYPVDLKSSVIILISFGLIRAVVNILSYYVSVRVPTTFDSLQKKRIMAFSLGSPESITMSKSMATFSELSLRGNKAVSSLISLITTIITIGFFLIVGLRLAPVEMVLGIVLLLLLSLPLRVLNKHASSAGMEMFKEWNAITNMLLDGVRNNFFFKMYGLLDEKRNEADEKIDKYLEHYNKSYFLIAIKNNFPNFLGILVLGILMFVSINYIKTPGATLLSFFYIFIRIALGLGQIQSSLTVFRIQLPALKELYSWYLRFVDYQRIKDQNVSVVNSEKAELLDQIDSSGADLKVENLYFKYPKSESYVLSDLSFSVKKGESLVIHGESGTGKTTLLSLLLGILSPSKGNVKIHDSEINSCSNILSRFVGYVGPDPYIITDTIRANLLYGHYAPETVTDEDIMAALDRAELRDYVESTENKLETFFNEEAPISTGQKQRLSIARVFLRKPKLVILDEITSNLDMETEKKIVENLKPFLKECTSLIVTHRMAMHDLATETIHLK